MPLIFKTEGFEALNDQLLTLAREIESPDELKGFKKILTMATTKTLNQLIPEVQSRAPYDEKTNKSGIHLRDTVRVESRVPTDKDRQSYFVEESDAVIGILSVKKSAVSLSQEFGNAHTPSHPFLRVTAERNFKTCENALKAELSERIPAYIKKLSKQRSK
jgi:hypothetical protein